MSALRYVLTTLYLWYTVEAHVNHTHEIKAEMLKNKWTVADVIRDIDHIREDMASIIELSDAGKLSEEEMSFYLIRMHDFDDNGGLDGIEIRTAVTHTLEHLTKHDDDDLSVFQAEVERAIDSVLQSDLNFDGLVDYGELRRYADRNRK